MLAVKNLTKTFGNKTVLKDVSLQVESGEALILDGASGTGKSTLMRCIAGLIPYDAGTIAVEDKELPIGECHEQVGMVLQSYELFPHYDAISNIMLPLMIVKKMDRSEARSRAEKLLSFVGLNDEMQANIASLSGGQQQRVAIARSIALDPKVLLLDEPTAALDKENTKKLVELIQNLRKSGTALIIATHDATLCELLGHTTKTSTCLELCEAG